MTTPGATPLIELVDIGKSFLTTDLKTHALMGVHLKAHAGEYLCIEGPSGSGKTTLMSIIGLLDSPSSGQYFSGGKLVSSLSPVARAQLRNELVGFIFQSFNLIGELTVLENVELPLSYRGLPRAEQRERSSAALQRVGMGHRLKHYPSQLSGGQQQRVAVARAVVGSPRLLLADEPTGNLDSKNGAEVMDLLDELHAAGSTICMVTHDREHARRARRRIQLFDGRIVADSSDLGVVPQSVDAVRAESLGLGLAAGAQHA
jgi:putative ABC transport system ATP-binding protein